jgi:predicted TIM-barrel fold metal-dependent hydrolase
VDVLRARKEPPRLEGDVLVTGEGAFPIDVEAALPETRLELLERLGIDVALVSLQPTLAPTEDVIAAYHEGMAEVADARIRPLAYRAALDGFAGATLPAHDLLELERVAPLLDELERRSQLLFVHPGPGRPVDGAPPWWSSIVDYTAQMQAAYAIWLWQGAERWPRLRVLFALLAGGAPFQLERLAGRGLELRDAVAADVYLDTSSYGPRALELCLSVYGIDRLVYGSDAPILDPKVSLNAVRKFGENVTAAICDYNPRRLLA